MARGIGDKTRQILPDFLEDITKNTVYSEGVKRESQDSTGSRVPGTAPIPGKKRGGCPLSGMAVC